MIPIDISSDSFSPLLCFSPVLLIPWRRISFGVREHDIESSRVTRSNFRKFLVVFSADSTPMHCRVASGVSDVLSLNFDTVNQCILTCGLITQNNLPHSRRERLSNQPTNLRIKSSSELLFSPGGVRALRSGALHKAAIVFETGKLGKGPT
jgi:hypothetical protein